MSIFKEDHREDRTFREWVRGVFGARCESFVTFAGKRVVCTQRLGHPGRHAGLRAEGPCAWAYGDNLLKLNLSYYLLKDCCLHLSDYLHHLRAENLHAALEVTNLLDDIHTYLAKELAK
jgi:hypothetical protein